MKGAQSFHQFGEFRVGDRMLFGELTVDGSATNLRLHSHQFIRLEEISDQYVVGELPDRMKVSLIECILPPVPGWRRYAESENSYFADIFPHFVVVGAKYVNPVENNIHAIHWSLPDLGSIFHDFDAFAVSLEPERFIEAIVVEQERQTRRKISIGPNPEIQYFTGNHKIFSCETVLGEFSVGHEFDQNSGGTSGVWMRNKIRASLFFSDAVCFREAVGRASKVVQFLSISIGVPQNIEDIRLEIEPSGDGNFLEVSPSLPVRYERQTGQYTPGPLDVLLEGVGSPSEFAAVLAKWLATNDEMAMPRTRFWDSFKKQGFYDPDRIIAAANLFDTIPAGYFPEKPAICPDVQEAIKKARQLFRPLPDSSERQAILRGLARVLDHSLRTKVKYWSKEVICSEKYNLEDLNFVIDRAVRCRNFFVHGGNAEFDYLKEINLFAFLTRTFEFCYVIPEFLRAGWSGNKCAGFHPFDEYRRNYAANLRDLRQVIGSN